MVISPRSELDPLSLRKSARKKWLARRLYATALLRSAAGFHATDKKEADHISTLQLDAPILLSPNGIDTSIGDELPDADDAKRRLGLSTASRYILFLSRFHGRKRPDVLLDAAILSGVFARGWELIIAGGIEDEALASSMRTKIRNANLSDRVHWKGHVNFTEKRWCFAASDVFALPTAFENFGNSIGEALACGVPVITTPNTPWTFLPERRAGWIAKATAAAFAEALVDATGLSPSALRLVGRNGRSIAAQYSWAAAGREMSNFYSTILADAQ